jgi:hypothetical protein
MSHHWVRPALAVSLCWVGLLTGPGIAQAATPTPPCTIAGTSHADPLMGTGRGDVICGRGDDRAAGATADDRVVETAKTSHPKLGDNPPWSVDVRPRYFMPTGTEVRWQYDLPSGNCMRATPDWTDTVITPGAYHRDEGQSLFTVTTDSDSLIGPCSVESSYGTWHVTATYPDGTKHSAWITFDTGTPTIYKHSVSGECHAGDDMQCYATSETYAPPSKTYPPTSKVALGFWDANPPWEASIHPRYFLPKGTTVLWLFDSRSAGCIHGGDSWTDYVWADEPGSYHTPHYLFTVNGGEACKYGGHGTWHVIVRRNDGQDSESWITFASGLLPNEVHVLGGNCQSGNQQCYVAPSAQPSYLPDPLQSDLAIGAWTPGRSGLPPEAAR